MAIQILDGGGKSNVATVNTRGQINVVSLSRAPQFAVSLTDGRSYQVQGDFASVNNSTHTVLSLQNTSSTKWVVVTYIRMQFLDFAGGTAVPDVATYWDLGFGRSRSSGGTEVTPVNMNQASGNVASVTTYDNNPTMTGTFTEIDRHYVKEEGEEHVFRKEGSVILGNQNSLELRITSDHTSGVAQARISFFEVIPEDII